ncbi:hypothetical protein [Curtobacterium sp. ME26]|uniref:hypothetical protein n=1 Tax=Curtobacterium sp. ME26 TaxID=2744254 RepID=UPI0015F56549|nr:hypothetical protein [Curtobacterium sp. ME26]
MNRSELVSLAGDVPERVRGRRAVAHSDVTITLDSEDAVQRCLDQLAESDERLAASAANYDWKVAIVTRRDGIAGGQVRFGVAWYDRSFYEAKRDVYLGEDHVRMFAGMGSDVADVEVSHYELAA